MLEECARRGIRVHIAGIWSGLYHTNASGRGVEDQALQEGLARMRGWRTLAAECNCTIEAMAVAFAALPRVVSKIVMGMKTKEEVAANIIAAEESAQVPPWAWREAQRRGLLPSHLTLP
eukprot:COSAG06_NODE_13267_length_1276_cov_0.745964_2_plen_119_part_00